MSLSLLLVTLASVDPLTGPFEYGVPVAAALVCVGLYIWSQLQVSAMKNALEQHSKSEAANFAALQSSQNAILNQQASTLSTLRDVAESIKAMAVAIAQQAVNDRDQMELLREQSADIKVLAATQTRLQDGLQKLLEQTIDVLARHQDE